jgi:hypothetical protein
MVTMANGDEHIISTATSVLIKMVTMATADEHIVSMATSE